MKLKNAGIAKGDWQEAARRLKCGEILYSQDGDKLGYKEDNIQGGISPFVVVQRTNSSHRSSGDPICGLWVYVELWQVEVEWTQNLPQFCWIWDNVEEKYTTATLVTEYVVEDEYPYKIGSVGVGIAHAEPFNLSKLTAGVLK